MKHPVRFALISFVAAAALWLIGAIYRDRELQISFHKIKAGDSESEVVQWLGTPKRIEPCGEFFGPLEKTGMEGCMREYLYASPFSPLFPQYYVVRFDSHGLVRSTAPYSSP